MYSKKQVLNLTGLSIIVILVALVIVFFNQKEAVVLATVICMIFFWLRNRISMAVVALIPLITFPLFAIASISDIASCYSDPVVFLFFGGLFLGIAVEKWNLHKRIALYIIHITGTNGNNIILGFMMASAFLSLWLSNTATTMMMFPIARSVIHVVESNQSDQTSKKNFAIALMLSVAYASNLAIGTIIGTPSNIAYANFISYKLHYNIGFANWMILFIPLTIILLAVLYLVLVKWLYKNSIKKNAGEKNFIDVELRKLGPISIAEKRVLYIFLLTVSGWICKDLINRMQHFIQLDDTIISLTGAILMFVIHSGEKKNAAFLLEWTDTNKMPWDILLLFGGGMALAKGIESVNLIQPFVNKLAHTFITPFLLVFTITIVSIFLSELISNVAQVMLMAPVVTELAISLHIDPLLLGIPMTLSASCAGMLPMGTPPNAIVYASGYFKMNEMVKAGLMLNIIYSIVIAVYCYLLQSYFLHS